jgi:hypothetical protein
MKALSLLFCCFVCGLPSLCFGADSPDAGKKAENTYCVACHSTRIINSQRLSAAAWTKEVDKMMGWGAVVPDKQLLIDYLATEYSNTKPMPTLATSGDGVVKDSRKTANKN